MKLGRSLNQNYGNRWMTSMQANLTGNLSEDMEFKYSYSSTCKLSNKCLEQQILEFRRASKIQSTWIF